jgi:hypothetical protein
MEIIIKYLSGGLFAETPVSRKNGFGQRSVGCFSSTKLNGPL